MSFDQARIAGMIGLALLTVVTTYSLAGLLAVWGAQGRGPWFLRMVAVLAFLAAWLGTVDRRLCLLFISQTAVVVLRLWFVQSRPARAKTGSDAAPEAQSIRPAGRHFSLADLLLVVVLASGVLAMLVRLPPQVRWDWYKDVLPGAFLGVFTLVAVWAAQSDRQPWLRAASLVVVFPALVMGAWLWLARRARGPVGRAAAALSLLLIAALPAKLYYAEFEGRSISYPTPLEDNGYVDLLRAAEMAVDPTVKVDTLSGDALRAYLDQQRSALELAERGLSRPCQAVLYERMDDRLLGEEGQRLEQLSRLFAGRGRLQLQDGRLEDAVESYLADIELGAAIANGGVMMHDGFGFVIERLGAEGLQQAIARLDDGACRKLAEKLAAIDARREPPESGPSRERLYFACRYPWKHRSNALARALFPSEPITLDALGRAAAGEKRARLRLLIGHLALRRFWLEAKGYPETLDELVPRYLPAVPRDPFSDRALIYKRLTTGYRLYSIGDDRVDDAGVPAKPLAWPVPNGDIVIDPTGP